MLAPGPPSESNQVVEFMGGPALPYDPSYHLLWRLDKIRAATWKIRPDVLEIHSPYVAALAGLSFRGRAPFRARTFFWHSDFIDTYERVLLPGVPFTGAITRPLWAWVRQIAAGCDRVIAASEDQESKLRAHGVTNVVRVPMGVDRAVFHPMSERPARADLVLVGAGRFAVEKRWDVVIDAVAHLRARGKNARLVLYGDGPERAKLVARAGEGVTILPFENDRAALARAIAGADAFVHGCPYETFGVALAEAVACATPVVVPDAGAAREHARGPSGRTYKALDPLACARAVEDLFAMDPSARREAAERAAKDVRSVEDHFRALLELYGSLL